MSTAMDGDAEVMSNEEEEEEDAEESSFTPEKDEPPLPPEINGAKLSRLERRGPNKCFNPC